MHIHPAFLCSLFPDATYVVYDQQGETVQIPLHLANHSLLPIARDAALCESQGTWWVCDTDCSSFLKNIMRVHAIGVRTLVLSPELFALFAQSDPAVRAGKEVIVVAHTPFALREAARVWRTQCLLPIVGIAGSVGKTTTMHVLQSIAGVDALPLFFSSEIKGSVDALAQNILHITSKHAAAVFELGAKNQGDTLRLAELLRPTMGVITSVGPAHLEGIGNLPDILSEHRSLFAYFSPSQIGIVCGDAPGLALNTYDHPVARFGFKHKNVVTVRDLALVRRSDGSCATECTLQVYEQVSRVRLPSHHQGVVYAALAAAATAYFLYIPFDVIIKGLERYHAHPGFFQVRPLALGSGMVIDDSKSLNPESVKASLHAVHDLRDYAQKIVVLGDMPALGEKAAYWHCHVGRELIKTRSIKEVVLVGKATHTMRRVAPSTMNVYCTVDWEEAHVYVHNRLRQDSNVVLVSGAATAPLGKLAHKLSRENC